VSGRKEVAIGFGAYGAYLLVRRAVWNERGREQAAANARRIIDLERALSIDVEADIQRSMLRVPGLVHGLNAGYAAGNVALSVGWLLRLYFTGDSAFVAERRALLIAFGAALPIFALYPTAPPRTLDGFVDTLGGEGAGLDHPQLVRLYNPIAAMPSHHVAFAVVTGMGLARRARTRTAKVRWTTYPGAVALVVIATANHFVADVIGGAVVGAVARRMVR